MAELKKDTDAAAGDREKAYDDTKDVSSLESRSERAPHGGEVFDTAGLEDWYKPIPSYEGIHRYDPSFRWTEPEEKKLVWKVRVSAIFCVGDQLLIYSEHRSTSGYVHGPA
jgi:hypothetical protein